MTTRALVVDSSVVLRWVLPEPGRHASLALLGSFEAGAVDLIAPGLLMEQVAATLSDRCREGILSRESAQRALFFARERQPMLPPPDEDYLSPAFSLSLQHHLSLSDAIYLAVAIAADCGFVTANRQLHGAVSRHYPFIRLLV